MVKLNSNSVPSGKAFTNERIVRILNRVAELLAAQGANSFRVNAYRRASQTISSLQTPIANLFEKDGVEGLQGLGLYRKIDIQINCRFDPYED